MKNSLEWPDLWTRLGMQRDRGGRWYPSSTTPSWVVDYLRGYRTPSRHWPNSYANALLTKKFVKKLVETDKKLVTDCGLEV